MNNAENGGSKKSIAFVVAAPVTAESFLAPHIHNLAENYEITVIGKKISQSKSLDPRANLIDIDIERHVNLKSDLMATFALFKLLRRQKFDLLQSMTPKAGLITALAGFAARIPIRIHWFTGQVWATRTGFSRMILKSFDRITAHLSTHLLVDSHPQMEYLAEKRITRRTKMRVLLRGSTCGVDTCKFSFQPTDRRRIRTALSIADRDTVLIFMGRLNRDKGIKELLDAYFQINSNTLHLLLLGEDEDEIVGKIVEISTPKQRDKIYLLGHVKEPQEFLSAADIFILPSHREGLPMSILQASSTGLPVIGTDIYGIRGALVHGQTGILVPAKETGKLAIAIQFLMDELRYRTELGDSGRKFVEQYFTEEAITHAYKEFLDTILVTKLGKCP